MEIIQSSLFDGKVCSQCQTWQVFSEYVKRNASPDGLSYICKQCRKKNRVNERPGDPQKRLAQKRAYREANKEKLKEQDRAYRQARRDQEYTRMRAWLAANPDRARARRRAWKEKNHEKLRQQHRHYTAANRERVREKRRLWASANPLRMRAKEHNRRTKKQGNGGKYKAWEWAALCQWFGNVCLCCKQPEKLTVDHVVPVAHGGTSNIDNLQPLCLPCNLLKGAQAIDYRDRDRLAQFLASLEYRDATS
jgi:5-methylcytosine-specific restriction endonuclease McrA